MTACKECGAKANVKYGGTCSKCGDPICPKHALFYGDESNIAITSNSRAECAICYGMRDVRGVVDFRNLLLSGDYQHRADARARFTIRLTPEGSRIA